jgi:hypothetical protein
VEAGKPLAALAYVGCCVLAGLALAAAGLILGQRV